MFLLIVFAICAASLIVILWVTTVFLQGYYYTEPTENIQWQAPAAGTLLAAFFTVWCLLLLNSAPAVGEVPYDTLFRFSPHIDMQKEPFREIWVVRKGEKEPVLYKRHGTVTAGQAQYEYRDTTIAARPYTWSNVEAVLVEVDGQKMRFNVTPAPEGSTYRELVADSGGWTMTEYERGPDGQPRAFRWSRFSATMMLNASHFLLWFLALWLLLRFNWPHALGLAVIFWLVMSLAILPMILTEAAGRAVV